MKTKTVLLTTLLGSVFMAAPAFAKDASKTVERKCEIRIENGKETRKGDCDGVEGKNIHISKGDGKHVRVMVMGDDEGGEMDKMVWINNGEDGDFDFADGDFPGLPHAFKVRFDHFNPEWDANGDGKVSPEEMKAAKKKELAKYDRNRNGVLELSEYQQYWMDKNHTRMVRAFQALDEDGDAKVTLDEFSAMHGPQMHKIFIKKEVETREDNDH